jgi:hypothetical protein
MQKMILGLEEPIVPKAIKKVDADYYFRLDQYQQLTDGSLFSRNDCKIITKRAKSGSTNNNNQYQYITKGGMGDIYFFYITIEPNKVHEVALKIQKFKPWQLEKRNFKSPFVNVWKELYLMQESVKLLQSRVTQNLPLTYWYRICKDNNDKYLMLYNELFDGNIKHWLQENHSSNEWKSFLFQIWHTIYLFNNVLDMVHYDYRLLNILFKKCEPGGYWKYTMGNKDYYVPNEGSVFVAYDFASADLLKFPLKSRDIIRNHMASGKDLFFIHELYMRIRVLILMESYSLSQIEELFVSKDDIDYKNKNKQINKERFDAERFEEKYKIALIYYLLENNRFHQLYDASKSHLYKLPPSDIDQLLKELNDHVNVPYADALNKRHNVEHKIPGPLELIDRFLPDFSIKKTHKIHFIS